MSVISDATRAAIPAARTRSDATMRRWRMSDAHHAAAAAFADGGESPERAAGCAEMLLADASWIEALLAPLVEALAVDPLFEPSLKFHRDAQCVGVVLFDCPAVSIAARVRNAAAIAALPPQRTIVFTGRIAVTRVVRAGGARLRSWNLEPPSDGAPGGLSRFAGSQSLDDGMVCRCDGRRQSQLIDGAAHDVVTLVATIRAGAAPLLREYDVASGLPVRVSDADDRPSRTAMLLHFLRAAGRADAASCFADATHAPDFHLRWAAMREWLALDAARAAPRLAAMAAADPSAEVRAAAGRMLPLVAARLTQCPA